MRCLDRSLGRVQRITLQLVTLCLAIATAASPVSAHGGGTPQIVDAPAGPYRLFAWTSPDPWRAEELVHVTVAVTRVDATGQVFPITDAQVAIRLISEAQPDQALTFFAQPVSAVATGFYEFDHKLPGDGLWHIEIEARGVEGVGVVAFTMVAEPAAPTRWLFWAGGAFVAAIGALIVLQAARQRALRREQTGQKQPVGRQGARPAFRIER